MAGGDRRRSNNFPGTLCSPASIDSCTLERVTEETPTVRRAARVVLLNGSGQVLLVRFAYRGRSWWSAPGGGLEDGETHEDAARREVAEETGFELEELGPWIWTREHVFRFEGCLYRQLERYFVASVPAFEPRPGVLGTGEARVFRGLHWWSIGELEWSAEEFAPADLPALVRRLVERGPPERPIRVGI
jgi:8-oxo-dGTP pyrophosphatase MutT (NUDIX family)